MKRSKAYRAAAEKIDADKLYAPLEAVRLAKDTSTTKYDATVEVAFRLGVDPRKADQMVRGTVNLPHGTGKTARVLVFATGERAAQAEAAGADYVGSDDLIEQGRQGGWLDFDAVVATPDLMGKVGRLGKVLGPRGLMPNPKTGTVTLDVAKAVTEIKGGKIEFRVDKHANLHFIIGKASFDDREAGGELRRGARRDPAAQAVRSKGRYIAEGDDDHHDGPGHPGRPEPHPQPAGRGGGAGLSLPPARPRRGRTGDLRCGLAACPPGVRRPRFRPGPGPGRSLTADQRPPVVLPLGGGPKVPQHAGIQRRPPGPPDPDGVHHEPRALRRGSSRVRGPFTRHHPEGGPWQSLTRQQPSPSSRTSSAARMRPCSPSTAASPWRS